jgi:hypothetical protein
MSSFGLSDFLEGSAPALPKILGTSGDVPSSLISVHLKGETLHQH